jgi:translation initiation factor 5A
LGTVIDTEPISDDLRPGSLISSLPLFLPIPMAWEQAEVRELKPNRFVMIGDEPCRIINITTSKPGKHGEAKARIEAFGIFDGQKRSIVHPVTHKVRVPIIDRRKAQVLAVRGNEVQLMDLENYETFELPIPEDFEGELEPGKEVYYLVAMGRRKLTKP